jgi:hypothetical protein
VSKNCGRSLLQDNALFVRLDRDEALILAWQSYVYEVYLGQRPKMKSGSSWVARDVKEMQEKKVGGKPAQLLHYHLLKMSSSGDVAVSARWMQISGR